MLQCMKIFSLSDVCARLESTRAGKIVVCANGSFDVLHVGHIRMLREAKGLGDILVVLLNSDASVRVYKGPGRPIIPQDERAEMLAALECVDYVVLFDEITPKATLDVIKPDVYASGSEWGLDCIEREVVERNGGCMHVLSQHGSLSTSGLFELIGNTERAKPMRAIFFDRDKTINYDDGYTYRIEDFVFVPRCMEAFHLLDGTDFKKVIITNQAGIGRGYYTERDFQKLNSWMLDQFRKEGITIDAVYHCPHAPTDGCACRKPKNGLILKAAEDLGLCLAKSWMVGDKVDDVVMGRECNMKTIKIGNPMPVELKLSATYTASDVFEAVRQIVEHP